jgi:hypothetical protein
MDKLWKALMKKFHPYLLEMKSPQNCPFWQERQRLKFNEEPLISEVTA